MLVIFLYVRVHVKTDGYNVLLKEKIISISFYLPIKTHKLYCNNVLQYSWMLSVPVTK
jgi:hypothetical protein